MYLGGYEKESINEGMGLRTVLSISGCKHHCPFCHSPETHSFIYGVEFSENLQKQIIQEVKKNPLLDGITFCGGDPFYSAKELNIFIKKLRKNIPDINIWIYSGFTFEEILNSKDLDIIELLKQCNVLIDGVFIKELKDVTLKFRGSSNQRIIDVKESLKQEKVVLYDI